MSRADKTQRRLRRKQRRDRTSRRRFTEFGNALPDVVVDEEFEPIDLGYELTGEPIFPVESEPERAILSNSDYKFLYDAAHDEPARVIPRLKALIEKCPQSRTLRNWLVVAYTKAGQSDEAEREARILYERFPDYLFARIGWARLCMQRGQVEQVPLIFDNRFDLKELYPDRDVFHISEFVAFTVLMIEYFIRIDDIRYLEHHVRLLNVAPDDPLAEYTTMLLLQAALLKMNDCLAKPQSGRKRLNKPPPQ